MSPTATAPTTGSLPHQRRAARHREPISGHEADLEPKEDWSAMCIARRCNGHCAKWRGSDWSAFEVRS